MSDTKPVSMRLMPKTLDAIEYIQEAIGARNRTQAIVEAINLARWWIQKRQEGARIYAESPDGERESVVMSGLEPHKEEWTSNPSPMNQKAAPNI